MLVWQAQIRKYDQQMIGFEGITHMINAKKEKWKNFTNPASLYYKSTEKQDWKEYNST